MDLEEMIKKKIDKKLLDEKPKEIIDEIISEFKEKYQKPSFIKSKL